MAIPVTMDDKATARGLVALLPLSLTFEDYAATEKVATLPRKRSAANAPEATKQQVGSDRGAAAMTERLSARTRRWRRDGELYSILLERPAT